MATPKELLWERDPHTAAKHDILVGYLQAWFPIIANGFGEAGLTCVDAFAGPGEYTGGEDGSPLLVLEQAQRDVVLRNGSPVRLLFIEERADRAAHLAELIDERHPAEGRPSQWDLQVVAGACEQVLIPALQTMGAEESPIFVNFDGFGVDTPMSLVRHVSRIPRAEVLITFQTQFFVRFAKNENQQAGDRVFGGPEWRALATEGTPEEKKRALLNLYRELLAAAGFTYLLTFELVDEGGHELLLIYGTSDERGLEKMKESMWKVDPIRGQRFRDPRDLNQIALDFGPDRADLSLLERQLLKRLEVEGEQTLSQLKRFTLLETIYKPTHAPQAVQNLAARNKVECDKAKSHDQYVVRLAAPQLFDL